MTMNRIALAIAVLLCASSYAQETLLLRSPSVNKTKIVFAYASDIWIAERDGSQPKRLTVNQDVEEQPMLSPDGNWIAFSGNYDGNRDVYVMPVTGGMPKRLTFHPYTDIVRGWHGTKVLFSTTRASFSWRFHRFFEVDALTGIETMLPIPEGHQGSISPDGKYIAYTKLPDPADKDGSYRPFKLYRGGNMPKVWIFNLATYDVEEVPAENSNNTQPVWVGDDIFFLSDRDKKNNNIFKYSRSSKKVEKLTSFTDFPVASLYSNGTDLSFEQGGKIYLMIIPGNKTRSGSGWIVISLTGVHIIKMWQQMCALHIFLLQDSALL